MAHKEQMDFLRAVKAVYPGYFRYRPVVEVGSRDVNGSPRELFVTEQYVGIDCYPGKGVDVVGIAHEIITPYYRGVYTVAIACEVFEHDPHAQLTIEAMIRALIPGGLFVATWASPERAEHGTPTSDGETYAPPGHESFYLPMSIDDFDSIVAGKLKTWSAHHSKNGEDIYAIGFK